MKRQNIKGRSTLVCLGLISVLGLQGCATNQSGGSDATQGTQGANQASDEVTFPEPEDAWVEEGVYVNLENLQKMQAGLSKDQIYDLLGRPHFSEGLFNVDVWNYIFHLPTGDGGYRVCQYQVQFDADMLAESLHWRESQCAALVSPSPQEPDKPSGAPMKMRLSADTLFEFDSAELLPGGQQQAAEIAAQVRDELTNPDIRVVGYTDRLGAAAYNQALSARRASAFEEALVANGVAPSAVQSRGAGESQPITRCESTQGRSNLQECLQPNRRVEVHVQGERRQ